MDADAEILLLIGADDAFGNHDGSDIGLVGVRKRASGVGKTENRNRNGKLRGRNTLSETDGTVSPPLRNVPLVVEIFEKLNDGMLAANAEFNLDFFERR